MLKASTLILFFLCQMASAQEKVWFDPETGHILYESPVDPANPYLASGTDPVSGQYYWLDSTTGRRYFWVDAALAQVAGGTGDAAGSSRELVYDGSDQQNVAAAVDWQSDRRFSCDGAVHEIINHTTQKIGGNSPSVLRNVPLQIDGKRHTYTTVGIRGNSLVVQMLLENLHNRSGKTMCICAEFRDSTVDWPIAALGGSYGMNPSTRRNESDSAKIDPEMAIFIDEVKIYAGYCPTNGFFKKTARIIGDTAWQSARAYVAFKTDGAVMLPESPD